MKWDNLLRPFAHFLYLIFISIMYSIMALFIDVLKLIFYVNIKLLVR